MHRIFFISFSLFLLTGILAPCSVFAAKDSPQATSPTQDPLEKKKEAFLLLTQKSHSLMGVPRDSPLLHRYLGKPSRIENGGYCYSYPSHCTKVTIDDLEEVCYICIDHHPILARITLSEVEEWLGEPKNKTVEAEGTYYLYMVNGNKEACPVLLLFKHNILATLSMFPSDF